MIPPIIHTKRLTLRQHIQGDIQSLQGLLSDSEVMKYSGLDVKNYWSNAEAELEWFKQLDTSDNGIRWIITLKNENLYLGDIGFLDTDAVNHRAEISYKLSRIHWNKGLITEALLAVLSYGFVELGLNRVTAHVHVCNGASQRVLRKLGFVEEGTLREHEYLYGNYADVLVFGLLKRELITTS